MVPEENPLARERENGEFDVEAMKVAFWGGTHRFELLQRLSSLVASDPVFKRDNRVTLTRKELLKSGLRKAAHARKLTVDHGLSDREALWLRVLIDERSYADLHWNMFIPVIEGQATVEQQEYWLPLARNMKIIGCYAQTELGHGSNVKGLETIATFNPSKDEFVLQSPTISSTKWWPGGLGFVSTHAVVQAKLIIGVKDYGIHAFIVQLRDLENHSTLPGIIIGDIGMKFGNGGTNTVDNGFLRFNSVCIPRTNMLMRMAEVTKEGEYKRSNVPQQILYGGMVTAREIIISEAAICLSRAVTIAVRYSAVRRQFGLNEKMQEIQVLNYATQQQRLFPLLASVYAFQFAAHWLQWLYDDVQRRLKKNDYSVLQEVHACTAGLKALTTSVTADGIEECRKLCGGHGYLCSSGLPELYAAYLPACTYEGENIILYREVGRIVLKIYINFREGAIMSGTTAYINKSSLLSENHCTVVQGEDFLDEMVILDAFEARSLRLICQCADKVAKMPNLQDGLDEHANDIVEMAKAHCQLIVISKFAEKLKENIPGVQVKEQLKLMFYVYALSLIKENVGEILSIGYMTTKQVLLAKEQLHLLYRKVRINAVPLVDSFNHTDHFLCSTLGSYDGDVYNNLYKEALKGSLNDGTVIDGYTEYIRPLLKAQLASRL